MTRAAFFDAIRPTFGGKLTAEQVQGIEIILTATEGLPIGHRAYLLATAKHETKHTMQPVRETLAKSDDMAIRALEKAWKAGKLSWVKTPYWRKDRDGKAWFGRGYVQLTHKINYQKAGDKIRVNLVADPSAALSPMIAARILVQGSSEGWFTGKKLSDYLPGDYVNARRVINGTDRAKEIAALAVAFEKALGLLGGIEVQEPKPAAPPRNDPKAFGLVWLIKFIMQAIGLLTWRKK